MENDVSLAPAAPPRRRSGKAFLLVFLLAFLLGGGAIGWLAMSGRLDSILPQAVATSAPLGAIDRQGAPALPPPANDSAAQLAAAEARADSLTQQLAELETRTHGAAGTAAHAENLLVAVAARRQIERGMMLGYLEDELKNRFGALRPEAVQTVLEASRRPVSLAGLAARLERLDASAGSSQQLDGWSRFRREMSELFVIRREDMPRATPSQRIDRARLLLGEGRIDKAIEQVAHLPGASGARGWVEDAQRYARTQRALDLIEESALTPPAPPPVPSAAQPAIGPTPLSTPGPTTKPAPESAQTPAPVT